MKEYKLTEKLLDFGKSNNFLPKDTQNESSGFTTYLGLVERTVSDHLNELFGSVKKLQSRSFSGHKHITYETGSKDCTVKVNFWTYKHKGNPRRPYTISVDVDGECIGVLEGIEKIAQDKFRSL